jgi:hypothetical protein
MHSWRHSGCAASFSETASFYSEDALAWSPESDQADFDPAVPKAGSFPFRGGATLIIEAPELTVGCGPVDADPPKPKVRFAIGKGMTGPSSKLREEKQRSFAMSLGMATGDTTDPAHFQANFGLVHEESRYG